MKIFGERLRELRTERKLTAKQLAKHLNTTDATVIRWENDTMSPKAEYIAEISKFFNVSADYLLGLKDY